MIRAMSGFDMFCERCGKRYGSEEATAGASPTLARRLLKVVGVGATAPSQPTAEPFLRFCLACRGYSCPACWNDDAGFCQTCVPLPEVEVVAAELPADPIPAFAVATELQPDLTSEPIDIAARLFDVEPVATLEPEPEPVIAFEAEPEPAIAAAREPELEAVLAFTPEPEPVMAAEPEPEPVTAAQPDAQPVLVMVDNAEPELLPTFAELEPPNEAAFADMAFVEPEPDVHWDWSLEPAPEPVPERAATQPETELPVAAQPVAPPTEIHLAAEVAAELQVAAEAVEPPGEALPPPVEPVLPPPPVFRPLEPMGPFLPPPPPPARAMPLPRLEFDLPAAPPAFVIARPPDLSLAPRPALPVGLFEGPGPQVRPCPNCELPVSARARFCRRCGSAQS